MTTRSIETIVGVLGTPTPATLVAWGDVISTSPTLVRFAGDTADTQVDGRMSSYTPTTSDRVVCLRVGARWIILGDLA